MIERILEFVNEKRDQTRIILGKPTSLINDSSNLDPNQSTLGLILLGLALLESLYNLGSKYLEREIQVRLKVLKKTPIY